MSLSLSCPCGAQFEVPDNLAGQQVACPECQEPVKAPAAARVPLRTSGYALASVVLALAGMFTVVGTLAAVVLGALALLSIARNRDRLAGTGYAVFGIVGGVILTALACFAYSSGELFGVDGWMRSGVYSSQVDYSGDLEVKRERLGYAVTRPSLRWGVAKPALLKELKNDGDLLLVNAKLDAYVDVWPADLGGSLDDYLDEVLRAYQAHEPVGAFGPQGTLGATNRWKVVKRERLPTKDGLAAAEMVLELQFGAQHFTFIDRVVQEERGGQAFHLRAWVARRRFPQAEPELRWILDSFRLLQRRPG